MMLLHGDLVSNDVDDDRLCSLHLLGSISEIFYLQK